MSLDDKIQQAADQLTLTYKQLNIIQLDLITQIEQEQETISQLEQGDIKKITFTFNRIAEYQQKLKEIIDAMGLIEKRAQKLKRRAGYVEEQAQKGN